MDGSVSFRAISIAISVSFGDTVHCADISALIAVSRLVLNALTAVSRIRVGHVQGMSDHHHNDH